MKKPTLQDILNRMDKIVDTFEKDCDFIIKSLKQSTMKKEILGEENIIKKYEF